MSTTASGRQGEDTAVSYLQKQGYKILSRNFRSRFGEIDIVAIDRGTLVFVEVKTRSSQRFGSPQEAVNYWKLRSITKTGEYYKVLHPKTPDLMRIDVLAIVIDNGDVSNIELIQNASG